VRSHCGEFTAGYLHPWNLHKGAETLCFILHFYLLIAWYWCSATNINKHPMAKNENGKESLRSAHASGMNGLINKMAKNS
jgi:hypothetical protein